jgi:oligopeptide transport system ATP-binding protein
MTEAVAARERRTGVGDVLLDVRDLRTYFHVMDGTVKAVDGVSFSLRRGGRLALVGESGCGKSVTALSIMRLIDTPPGEFAGGEIMFDGRNLLKLNDREIRKVRGGEIAMIFQEPMTSLNPVMTVGNQISEAVLLHQGVNRKGAREIALQSLVDVGVPDPKRRLSQYPFELSGGMRQRIMIAMALSCNPKLIIADEPTTALDVTIQRQILELIKTVQERTGTALLLITHDLGVVAEHCNDIQVMYAGKVAEFGSADDIYYGSHHPYTWGLLQSITRVDEAASDRLRPIRGQPPSLINVPPGCSFHPRCPYVMDVCRVEVPPLLSVDGHHASACHLPLAEKERILHEEVLTRA